MDTANLLMFFVFFFQFLSGFTTASPVSSLPTSTQSINPDSWITLTPVATRDDDHLCFSPTDIVFDYGKQTNQTGIKSDCENLTQQFKAITDEQGNITEPCGGVPPPTKVRGEFNLLGSAGNCALWAKCLANDSQNEVKLAYGDLADVIKVAMDGLEPTVGSSKNQSILSVSASTECQSLQLDWMVEFNGNVPGTGSQEGGLRNIASNFSPVRELQE